jgi:hypothetical protein
VVREGVRPLPTRELRPGGLVSPVRHRVASVAATQRISSSAKSVKDELGRIGSADSARPPRRGQTPLVPDQDAAFLVATGKNEARRWAEPQFPRREGRSTGSVWIRAAMAKEAGATRRPLPIRPTSSFGEDTPTAYESPNTKLGSS